MCFFGVYLLSFDVDALAFMSRKTIRKQRKAPSTLDVTASRDHCLQLSDLLETRDRLSFFLRGADVWRLELPWVLVLFFGGCFFSRNQGEWAESTIAIVCYTMFMFVPFFVGVTTQSQTWWCFQWRWGWTPGKWNMDWVKSPRDLGSEKSKSRMQVTWRHGEQINNVDVTEKTDCEVVEVVGWGHDDSYSDYSGCYFVSGVIPPSSSLVLERWDYHGSPQEWIAHLITFVNAISSEVLYFAQMHSVGTPSPCIIQWLALLILNQVFSAMVLNLNAGSMQPVGSSSKQFIHLYL